jgi:hypothetical protein
MNLNYFADKYLQLWSVLTIYAFYSCWPWVSSSAVCGLGVIAFAWD